MQKLITHICWTRHGIQEFTDEINNYLEEGWNISGFNIEKKGFRFICYALLVDLPLEPDVEVAE